jgi:hypothetical protein
MAGRNPGSIGMNPTIVAYSVILGGVCAVAAYTERYRRDQDEIDVRLKAQYYSNIKEQQAKIPQITQAIRGQDVRLDDKMNKWVWGGKANMVPQASPESGGGGGGNSSAAVSAATSALSKDVNSSSSSDEEEWGNDEDLEEEKKLSKKERRRRRKERKLKREERRKKQQEAEQQKLVLQSVAAGAAVGAVAVAASMFLGSGRK